MSIPIRVDAGIGGGGTAAGSGAAAATASGAPSWLILTLVGFTLLFVGLLVLRLGRRGARKAPATLAAVLLVGTLGLGAAAIMADTGTASAEEDGDAPAATAEKPLVALTFDDGPTLRLTPAILAVLAKYDVKATFFVTGQQAQRFPWMLKIIDRAGHTIGNHSYAHPDFKDLDYDQAWNSIEWTNRIIEKAIGKRPVLFRYPFGSSSPAGDQAVRDLGMYDVLWHWSQPGGSGDWECPGAGEVGTYVKNNLAPGAILLLHDGGWTANCGWQQLAYLPDVIETARAQGYEFGTVATADGPSHLNQSSWVQVVPAP